MTHLEDAWSVTGGAVYIKHTGERHRVAGIVVHTETNERLVVHTDIANPEISWAEPVVSFFSRVVSNGISIPQFKREAP